MLRICGCPIPAGDTEALVRLLEDDVTLTSDEAAAAICHASDADRPIDTLDADIRTAILHVIAEPPSDALRALRDALASGCC